MSLPFNAKRKKGGPNGFVYAVTDNDGVVAWLKSADDAELFVWAKNMEEELRHIRSREMIDLLWDYFSGLRRRQ